MRLEQVIRLQRRCAERQAKAIHAIGCWPQAIRKINLFVIRQGFQMKLQQIRDLVDSRADSEVIREYARSNFAILGCHDG